MFFLYYLLFFAISLDIVKLEGTYEDIDRVQKAFIEHEVVKDVIPYAPKGYITVKYPSGVVADLGNVVTPTQVKDEPQVSWEACRDEYYVCALLEPDAPNRHNRTTGLVKLWLVVNIPGDDVHAGEVLAEFVGSGPPKGSGLHRYVYLVYKQPCKIDFNREPRTTKRSVANRYRFSINKFAEKYNLGKPIAGNFYRAQYDAYTDVLSHQLGLS